MAYQSDIVPRVFKNRRRDVAPLASFVVGPCSDLLPEQAFGKDLIATAFTGMNDIVYRHSYGSLELQSVDRDIVLKPTST